MTTMDYSEKSSFTDKPRIEINKENLERDRQEIANRVAEAEKIR